MTDGQAARPQHMSLDTPHGLLELTWPQPQQVNFEGLEPVAGMMLQDPAPTALLNGKPVTVQRARQIVAGMSRTAAERENAEIGRLHGQLADRDAEIARLQAELDGMRQVPVEYAPTAALEAAMAADPAREDGTVLRETGGEKRAFEWKAAAGEWVQIS